MLKLLATQIRAFKTNPLPKLFVADIPWHVADKELNEYFSGFGEVYDATVMVDDSIGLSRGFGYVSFKDPASYQKVEKEKVHILEGRKLRIERASNKKQHY